MIRHNIGIDISKYFYGGYSLEDNLGGRPAEGWNHSGIAKDIVNDLIVAKYEVDIPTAILTCQLVDRKAVNSLTSVISLRAINGTKHFKSYYEDQRMIGKHFRLMSSANPNIIRHYTICNVMEPSLY